MSSPVTRRFPGYLMAEAIITLAIVSVLVTGFAGLATVGVDHIQRITTRLEAERTVTAALIAALALTRDGVGSREIQEALQREHPEITVTVQRGRLLIDAGAATKPVTVLLSGTGVRR